MSPPVLIVGAGPSGLTLALALAQSGINVRIVDKVAQPMVGQRGAGIQPRTLELESLLGTSSDILAQGNELVKIKLYPEPPYNEPTSIVSMREIRDSTPNMQFPNVIMLWQQRHESILRSHLNKYGVQVEYGTELKAFEQTNEKVSATLVKHIEERETVEAITASYLVSIEGAHSVVRKGLGLTFLGETTTEHFAIADIEVLEGMDHNHSHFFGKPTETMIVFMRCEPPSSNYFCMLGAGAKFDYGKAASSREAMISTFYELTGRTDIKFGDILSLSLYTPNIRMINKFSEDRCFVAGDAAHVHSPTGGQGLNSGIQDSINLAWKLAAVIKGHAPPSLLESYTAERLPVIAAMLGKTRDLHYRSFSGDADAWKRGGALDMFGINYRSSPIVVDTLHTINKDTPIDPYMASPELTAGDRAPDAIGLVDEKGGDKLSLYKIFEYTRHTALIFARDSQDIVELVNHLTTYDNVKTVVMLPPASPFTVEGLDLKADLVVEDIDGHAYNAYVAKDTSRPFVVAIVRPDTYIGALVDSIEGIKRYFAVIRKYVFA